MPATNYASKIMKTKLILFFTFLLATVSSGFAQYNPPPQISVTGSAEVKVAPDEIRLNVAVETRSETLEPARVENDEKVAAAAQLVCVVVIGVLFDFIMHEDWHHCTTHYQQ